MTFELGWASNAQPADTTYLALLSPLFKTIPLSPFSLSLSFSSYTPDEVSLDTL